jgi:hypothetical protein
LARITPLPAGRRAPGEVSDAAAEALELIDHRFKPGRRVPTKVFTRLRQRGKFDGWPTWGGEKIKRVFAELVGSGHLRRDGKFYVRTDRTPA